MIDYNRNHFFVLYEMLNEILDETILIKDTMYKLRAKLSHKLFIIGKEYDIINNSLLTKNKHMITNRSKLIHMKKTNKALREELDSKGSIKIIFD